jgi:hypothetical protein
MRIAGIAPNKTHDVHTDLKCPGHQHGIEREQFYDRNELLGAVEAFDSA